MEGIICSVNESVSGTIQNMPKVYFCCHPDDFEEYFQKTKNELYKIYPKISFWYYEKDDEPEKDKINQMNLMVIIVTNKFLEDYHKVDYSCYKALKLAEEWHIPLLPLLQEGVPEESYNHIFGPSQYLSKTDSGDFSIPYEEKLKKRLNETLLNDEVMKQIKDAFVAIAFLSYRKKDRKFVNKIMELIHSDEKYRDVGIWYDEFLTPGEAFDKEIESVLVNSDLFVLMVTSNLLEKGNYVIESEYPKAVEHKLPIISVECAETDNDAFCDIFPDVENLYPVEDAAKISEAIGESLKEKVTNTEGNDPRHLYLMGSAYLYGVDVEKNSIRALELLTKAAELGYHEAYERLTSMYHNGDGIKADYEQEIVWQHKYVERLKDELSDENSKMKLFLETKKLAECVLGRLRFDEAKNIYKEALELFKQLKFDDRKERKIQEYQLYSELGDSIRLKASEKKKKLSDAEVQEAKEYYLHALEICERDPWQQHMQYTNLGGLLYQLAEFIILDEKEDKDKEKAAAYMKEAEEYCKKALENYTSVEANIQKYEALRGKSILLDRMAGIYRLRENFKETLKYFEESLRIWEKFKNDYRSDYHEEGYALAQFNYAETLYNLGKEDAEKELIKTTKLVRALIDKKGGLTSVGIMTGYRANYILTLIYQASRNQKKYQYHKNAMDKFEAWVSRIVT